ncbi:beta-lactamase family protein [Streptomyces sp. A7024]|uniref:Beta-lactamase family protein n=1 Tax=Streptomyces coryli TaxID=1128680 RepID=A0A6G4TZV3_9ACTN|nr:serine hydrolase domain-containing protein [Streptomyces coryli]NGN65505.1 beta-lactamase family protein [Streptomyces coryli]
MMIRRGTTLGLVLALGAALMAPAGAAAEESPGQHGRHRYPGAEWERGDAARAGFNPAKLAELAADAQAKGSNCLVVVRHGKLVGEWYWNGTGPDSSQEVWSVTKSVTSTLAGIAESARQLDVDDRASKYIEPWAGTGSAAVTVEDLLSNDSGRHWSAGTDYGGLITTPDRTGLAVGLSQDAPPGEVWAYNNAAIQTLDDVLSAATGTEPAAYADKHLLGPLGMADSRMTKDPSGNTNTFMGLQSTCEDLARFGHLFLRDGRWKHDRVLPRRWVRAATGRPSQDISASYGYLWWLNHHGPVASDPLDPLTREESAAAPHTRLVPGAPGDMYWAIGLGGQVVQVHPDSDTIVVRLGPATFNETYTPADSARVVTEALGRQ